MSEIFKCASFAIPSQQHTHRTPNQRLDTQLQEIDRLTIFFNRGPWFFQEGQFIQSSHFIEEGRPSYFEALSELCLLILRWTHRNFPGSLEVLCTAIQRIGRVDDYVLDQIDAYLGEIERTKQRNLSALHVSEDALKEDKIYLEKLVSQSLQTFYRTSNRHSLEEQIASNLNEILKKAGPDSVGLEEKIATKMIYRMKALFRIEYTCKNFDQVDYTLPSASKTPSTTSPLSLFCTRRSSLELATHLERCSSKK